MKNTKEKKDNEKIKIRENTIPPCIDRRTQFPAITTKRIDASSETTSASAATTEIATAPPGRA